MDTIFWTAVAAIAAVLAAVATWLAFWLKFGDRVSKAEGAAAGATEKADAALRATADVHNRITTEQAAMGLYRERIAAEYVHRDMLREMEERIMGMLRDGIIGLRDQLKEQSRELGARIDKALDARGPKAR